MLCIYGGRESDYCKAREEGKGAVREGGTEEGGTICLCWPISYTYMLPCPALPCPHNCYNISHIS